MRGHGEKQAICLSSREALADTNAAHTSISNFWLPELCNARFLSCKPPGLWYLVMVAPSQPIQRIPAVPSEGGGKGVGWPCWKHP